jgi:PPOX class probable F420-dependent enzyme
MTSTQEIGDARYVLLTTYRKDGTPVDTPVWIVPFDGALAIWTGTTTGKVRRVRRNPTVTLATCNARGGNAGSAHGGRAEMLPDTDGPRVLDGLRRKYGWTASFYFALNRYVAGIRRAVRRAKDTGGGPAYMKITLDAS